MLYRYACLDGDRTTAGGTVHASRTTHLSVKGKRMAVEGDPVYCPACGQTGEIVCTGPRRGNTTNGKLHALNDDLCQCGCSPAPRLVNSETMWVERHEVPHSGAPHTSRSAAGMGAAVVATESASRVPNGVSAVPQGGGAAAGQGVTPHIQWIRTIDLEGYPVKNRECIFEHDAEMCSGRTDADGYLQVATSDSEAVRLHAIFSAPRRVLVPAQENSVAKADYEATRWTSLQTTSGSGKDDAIDIAIDDRAATRQAILDAVKADGARVVTTSDWHPKEAAVPVEDDWNYSAIVVHHAGNSYQCSADGLEQLRKAEITDIHSFGRMSYHYAIDCAGILYESLDIRKKGAHLSNGNSGKVGIVLLADLSFRAEALEHGPKLSSVVAKKPSRWEKIKAGAKEIASVAKDAFDTTTDVSTVAQTETLISLASALVDMFDIKSFGGHREFALNDSDSRPCPGENGLRLVHLVRLTLNLKAPSGG